MPGELVGDEVLLRDEREATQLYNKGAFGIPQSGGGLVLDLVEAAYLVEANRLEVREKGKPVDLARLLARGAAGGGLFEVRWHVYRDLRGRSLVTKPAPGADFQIYPRGGLPGRDAATHRVHAITERDAFLPAAFVEDARDAARFGKRVLAALVDEEGDVTYYEGKIEELSGATTASLADLPGRADLLTDRVVVHDALLAAELAKEHYGRAFGGFVELSMVEAAFLAERAGLEVRDGATGERVAGSDLRARAAAVQPDFALRFDAFAAMRDRGLVPKTGFKYGTHYRVYRGGPDEAHAPYLVHAVRPDAAIPWPEVAGFIRVSHGVRKSFVLHAGDAFLSLAWTRP